MELLKVVRRVDVILAFEILILALTIHIIAHLVYAWTLAGVNSP
jgi:hypothetical protein